MAARRKKKKHTGLIVLAVLLIIGAGLFAGRHAIIDGIKTKAIKEVSKKLMESQLGGEITVGGQTVNVSEIIDHMEEADVEKVNSIAEKYVSQENISNYLEMVQSGDMSGLKEQAKESLTPEDKQELQGIYEKYIEKIE